MPLFYIAFYQLDVITLRAEIASLFMSESSVGGWMVHGLVCLCVGVCVDTSAHVHMCAVGVEVWVDVCFFLALR